MQLCFTSRRSKFVVIATVLATIVFTSTALEAGLFRKDLGISGTIVDLETHQPIAGAVVMALWCREVFRLTIESKSEYYDYYETVSDQDGNFTIPGKGLIILKNVPPPRIKIFKSGYHVFSLWRLEPIAFNDISPRNKAEWNNGEPILYIDKSTLEERRKAVTHYRRIPFSEMARPAIFPEKYHLYREEVEKEYAALGQIPYWKQDHTTLKYKTRIFSPSGDVGIKPKSAN